MSEAAPQPAQSSRSGPLVGLKVVESKTKAFIGETIMCGAGQTGPSAYQGSLRHLEQGKTYTGKRAKRFGDKDYDIE